MDPKQQFQQQSQKIEQLAHQIEVDHSSDDSAVRVVMGAGGAIKDLELNHRAFQATSGNELGQKILDTIRQAETQAQEQMSARMSEILGTDVNPRDLDGRLDES